MAFLVVLASFGLAAGIIGRAKGSSFFIWLLIGAAIPFFGLLAAILYRSEREEPVRRCPRCGKVHLLYVQVCNRCGEDMYMPEPSEIRRKSLL